MRTYIPLFATLALSLSPLLVSCMDSNHESDDDELAPNPAEFIVAPDEQDEEPIVHASDFVDYGVDTVFVPTPFGMQEAPYEVINGELIHDDMIIGKEEDLERSGVLFSNIGAGGAMGWPGGVIPYEIATSIAPLPAGVPGLYTTVKDAIDEWNEETAVYVRPRIGNEQPYVVIQAQPANAVAPCQADLGVGWGGRRNIHLKTSCSRKSVKHELAHIVGIPHEQSRADRDGQVIVHDQFVNPGAIGNFFKYGTSFGKYDFQSIMHYSNYACTMIPRRSVRGIRVGGEMTLSRFPKPGLVCPTNDERSECRLGGSSLTTTDKAGIVRATDGPNPGAYRLRNVWSQNCLRSSGDHHTPGSSTVPSSCSNTNSRRWYSKTLSGGGDKILVHRYSRMCLAMDGNNAILGDCDRSSTSEIKLVAKGGGEFQLKQGNRCLREIGGDIFFSSCNNTPSRRWTLQP